jgi:hypothetical protein
MIRMYGLGHRNRVVVVDLPLEYILRKYRSDIHTVSCVVVTVSSHFA